MTDNPATPYDDLLDLLRAEAARHDTPAWEANERLNAQVDRLARQNERLRAALRNIAAASDLGAFMSSIGAAEGFRAIADYARSALVEAANNG